MIHTPLRNNIWLHCTTFIVASIFVSPNVFAGMIFQSSSRGMSSTGSQLNEILATTESFGAYSEDILNSGYVRDENNAIVGSVTASSSQTSTLTANQIRGLGRGSGFGSGPADGAGNSFMSVQFSVDESTQFTLAGQLRLAPHGGEFGLNGSSAYVRLREVGSETAAIEVLMDEMNQPDNLGMVDFTGDGQLSRVLPAGEYILEAFAEGLGSHGLTRCADFDFTLTALEFAAVPEPTAMCLLLLGSLSCLRMRSTCR